MRNSFAKMRRKLAKFDPDMARQRSHGYDSRADEARYLEDFQTSSTKGKEKLLEKQIKYWRNFGKYLHKSDIHIFDKSIDLIEQTARGEYLHLPGIQGEIKSENGDRIKITLSAYNRLFARLKVDLPPYAEMNFSRLKFMLEDYISQWSFPFTAKITSDACGVGKFLHVHVSKLSDNLEFCTSFRDHESGAFNNIEAEYRWFKRIIAIAWRLTHDWRNRGGFKTTYATEYRKYIDGLNLVGWKIVSVKNNNALLDYNDKTKSGNICIEMDGFFTLEFDDGRILGFSLSDASTAAVTIFDDWNVLEKESARSYYKNEKKTTASIFKDLIGKEVAEVEVHSSDNEYDVYGRWPEELSENQGDFILDLILKFTDGTSLLICPGEDWTDVELIKNPK